MDSVQATLLILGIGVCLIPLDWVQSVMLSQDIPVSVWTLLVPLVGISMVAVSLVSYHKDTLRIIFYGVCQAIDQTGMGIGLSSMIPGIKTPGNAIPTAPTEGFTTFSQEPSLPTETSSG